MALSFTWDPKLTDGFKEQVIELWVAVTNAGGAVGFVAPVTTEDVLATAGAAFDGVASGVDHLLAGFDGHRLVALLFVTDNRFDLKAHWRVLKRVMVAPGSQGKGYGAALMAEAAGFGRRVGLAGLQVSVRAGHGTERFYERLGYREVGRLPGALRIGPGDYRDEILMWLPLSQL